MVIQKKKKKKKEKKNKQFLFVCLFVCLFLRGCMFFYHYLLVFTTKQETRQHVFKKFGLRFLTLYTETSEGVYAEGRVEYTYISCLTDCLSNSLFIFFYRKKNKTLDIKGFVFWEIGELESRKFTRISKFCLVGDS